MIIFKWYAAEAGKSKRVCQLNQKNPVDKILYLGAMSDLIWQEVKAENLSHFL